MWTSSRSARQARPRPQRSRDGPRRRHPARSQEPASRPGWPALLIGPSALGDRVHPRLGRLVRTIERFCNLERDRPARISFNEIAEIASQGSSSSHRRRHRGRCPRASPPSLGAAPAGKPMMIPTLRVDRLAWPDGSYRQSPAPRAPGGVPRREAWIVLGGCQLRDRDRRANGTSRARRLAHSRHRTRRWIRRTVGSARSHRSRLPPDYLRSREYSETVMGSAPDLFGLDLPPGFEDPWKLHHRGRRGLHCSQPSAASRLRTSKCEVWWPGVEWRSLANPYDGRAERSTAGVSEPSPIAPR